MIIKDQILNKAGIPLYSKMLHLTSASQKLTASNVANVATPGYQSKSINFQREMQAAMGKKKINLAVSDPRHIPPANKTHSAKVISNDSDDDISGVNNVDINKEMSTLVENQLLYNYGAKMLMRKFSSLKTVIRGRR